MTSLYDTDFCLWLMLQARLLKKRRFEELDLDNLVEEIESVERDQRSKIRHHLKAMMELQILHDCVPHAQERPSWYADIVDQRVQIETRLEISPSLYEHLEATVKKNWQQSRDSALYLLQKTYGLTASVPVECSYPIRVLLSQRAEQHHDAFVREKSLNDDKGL